jgi:hypothetical protein
MSILSRVGRRRFLKQSAAVLARVGVFGSNGPVEQGPMLRTISSWKSSPNVNYFFAFDAVKFYRNIEPEMKAVSDAGFNALYLIYHPYRSEDSRATPWQENIPLNDPDFASAPPPVPADREAEAQTFQHILAACRNNRLKVMFNVGCWSPQKWFRENPNAISKLPDGSPQYDEVFQRIFHKQILTPCFRSARFLSYTDTVVRTWLRQYHGTEVFEAVLPRVRVTNRFEIRLDPSGSPLFYIHQDTIDRDWCHCPICQNAFRNICTDAMARWIASTAACARSSTRLAM